MIPAAELAVVQAGAEEALPDTCTRTRKTTSRTPNGGIVETYGSPVTYAFRLVGLEERELIQGGRLVTKRQLAGLLPHDADVEESTDRLSSGGKTYAVTGTDAGPSERVLKRVWLVEIT